MLNSLTVSLAVAAAQDIKLPAETAVLKKSTLPGYSIAEQKCGICHSADYINLQPPKMKLTQWTDEMVKMRHSYGAPIDDTEIKLLSVYLTSAYGDATTVTAADTMLKLPSASGSESPQTGSIKDTARSPAVASKIDVKAILDHNNCLSCHALQQKVVGPAYHDVAAKYKDDPQALSKVSANIRAGGSGKWGAIPMPPFPGLSSEELQALSTFVLSQ